MQSNNTAKEPELISSRFLDERKLTDWRARSGGAEQHWVVVEVVRVRKLDKAEKYIQTGGQRERSIKMSKGVFTPTPFGLD